MFKKSILVKMRSRKVLIHQIGLTRTLLASNGPNIDATSYNYSSTDKVFAIRLIWTLLPNY